MASSGDASRRGPSSAPIIFDASPSILLDRLGYLPALRELHVTIVIPLAVSRELGSRPGMPASAVPDLEWVKTREARDSLLQRVREGPPSIDSGEAEAIALVLRERATVALDDLRGRERARRLGVDLTGTIGQLLAIRRLGIPSAFPIRSPEEDLQILHEAGMHFTGNLRIHLLQQLRKHEYGT
jgi:predicted nucleic acid-binding protein